MPDDPRLGFHHERRNNCDITEFRGQALECPEEMRRAAWIDLGIIAFEGDRKMPGTGPARRPARGEPRVGLVDKYAYRHPTSGKLAQKRGSLHTSAQQHHNDLHVSARAHAEALT